MTATIIQFPSDWQKSITTIAATGRVIESWEAVEGNRRANILKEDDGFYWRAYRSVAHREPTSHQRFRPLTDWTFVSSLLVAMTSAKSVIAA
jgi:hypothetical protein